MYTNGTGKRPVVEVHRIGEREGYGSYLGDIWMDISNVADKVGIVSRELSQVARGEKKIATVPTDKASITIPLPGKPVGVSIPLLPLVAGIGVLAYMAFHHPTRGRRR